MPPSEGKMISGAQDFRNRSWLPLPTSLVINVLLFFMMLCFNSVLIQMRSCLPFADLVLSQSTGLTRRKASPTFHLKVTYWLFCLLLLLHWLSLLLLLVEEDCFVVVLLLCILVMCVYTYICTTQYVYAI